MKIMQTIFGFWTDAVLCKHKDFDSVFSDQWTQQTSIGKYCLYKSSGFQIGRKFFKIRFKKKTIYLQQQTPCPEYTFRRNIVETLPRSRRYMSSWDGQEEILRRENWTDILYSVHKIHFFLSKSLIFRLNKFIKIGNFYLASLRQPWVWASGLFE